MTVPYCIRANQITFSNKKKVTFDFEIIKSLEYDGLLIILLEVPGSTAYNQNVYALDGAGNIIWQLQRDLQPHETQHCPFVNIQITNGDLHLQNRCGFLLLVNPYNGKPFESIFTT